jgi:hypothetical protein
MAQSDAKSSVVGRSFEKSLVVGSSVRNGIGHPLEFNSAPLCLFSRETSYAAHIVLCPICAWLSQALLVKNHSITPRFDSPDDLRRIAHSQTVGRDDFCHHRTRPHHHLVADFHSWQNDGVYTNQAVFPYGCIQGSPRLKSRDMMTTPLVMIEYSPIDMFRGQVLSINA